MYRLSGRAARARSALISADERWKSNSDIRSPIAGPFVGTYGSDPLATGFGRLSRLRPDSGGRPQLASMNFSTET